MYRVFFVRADRVAESISQFETIEGAINHCKMLKKGNPLITKMWIKDKYGNIKKIL